MSFFYIGLVRGYSAPAVPSIEENDPELLPTKNIASWASKWLQLNEYILFYQWAKFPVIDKKNRSEKGAVPPCGAFFGSILAAASLHFIGRKYTIVIASPLAFVGWVMIATATRYEVVILARFINGFCVGLCLPSAQVYVSEKNSSIFPHSKIIS